MTAQRSIDHPLLEAVRILDSGFLDPDSVDLAVKDWRAGPPTAARLRESIFEILGDGFRGCVPVALEAVVYPEEVDMPESVGCTIIGIIDDASVLELEDGSWFGGVRPEVEPDRAMVGFQLIRDSAKEVEGLLDAGRKPVWAIPAMDLEDLGTESAFRRSMEEA